VIDRAHAKNCNRSEKSSASRIAARRSIPSANRIIISRGSSPIMRALATWTSPSIVSRMACVASRWATTQNRNADEVERPTVTLLSWTKY
jgi:hypothetical protein